jgi:prolipoprotein diacylglyceryltransferase
MMIAIGLSDLASGNAFGEPAHLPWSIFLWGEWRQPSQVYETLGAIAVLLWVLLSLKRYDSNSASRPTAGILFLEFVAWSAGLRIFLEMFRGDGTLIFGQIRAAQVIAWVILSVCLFLLGKKNFRATI